MISLRKHHIACWCMLQALFAVVFAQATVTPVTESASGLANFTKGALPTLFFVGSCIILLYAFTFSAKKVGMSAWSNHVTWFIANALLALLGLILIFGPDSLTSNAYVGNSFGSNFNSPRAATLGFQIVIQAAIGICAIMTLNAYAALFYCGIGIFNFLGLMGTLYLFNFNQPIWLLSTSQCTNYFREAQIGRCADDGFLQALRVFGTFAIFVEGLVIMISLLSYASAMPSAAPPIAMDTMAPTTYPPTQVKV